ncbi:MAG: hypothetical protein AB1806_13845 [Acidobacteriota bacterium]
MEVFLVPLGRRGYELYCEAEDHSVQADAAAGVGLRRRVSVSFRESLAFLERERQARLARRAAKEYRTVLQRVRDRVLGWMAERVAEQRLLWQLRHVAETTAHYPDDLAEADASRVVLHSLRQDATRHLRWGSLNLAGAVLFAPFTFVPGPNLPAYYFWFRVVGHALSYVGARHGLTRVRWRYAPSRPLAELRDLVNVTGEERVARAREAAGRLGLAHLERFVERLLLGSA